MPIVFNCKCGKEFNAKDDYAGKRARCPQCRREFRIPNQSTFGPVELTTSATLPQSTPSNMPPVLTVEVGDDVVQRMEEAEPPESGSGNRPVWRDPILLYGGGIPLLALVVFFGYVALRHAIRNRMPTRVVSAEKSDAEEYRKVLLAYELERFRDNPEDSDDLRKARASLRKQYTDAIRIMPEGKEGWNLLYETSRYFREDLVSMWLSCTFATEDLAKDGIVEEPLTILKGANAAVQPRKFRPEQLWGFRQFIVAYESFRRERLDHDEAIAAMIKERYFDRTILPERFSSSAVSSSPARAGDPPNPKHYVQQLGVDGDKWHNPGLRILVMRGLPETNAGLGELAGQAAQAAVDVEDFVRFTEEFLSEIGADIEPPDVKPSNARLYRLTPQMSEELARTCATYGTAVGIDLRAAADLLATVVRTTKPGPDKKVDRDSVFVNFAKLIGTQRAHSGRVAPILPQVAALSIDLERDRAEEGARLCAGLDIRDQYERKKSADSVFRIEKTDVQPISDDDRKIRWLWEATVTVGVTETLPLGVGPKSYQDVWKTLIRWTPTGHGDVCWRETTMSETGVRVRAHIALSEWTKHFRSVVAAAWLKTSQSGASQAGPKQDTERFEFKFPDGTSSTVIPPPRADGEKRPLSRKETFANRFRISVEELDEILKASD
jgi:hypothetical protein